MALRAPLYTGDFSDDERSLIAGFILHFRRGILQAAESVGAEAAQQLPEWSARSQAYFANAESVTRFLLYEIGYPVQKGQMWSPFYDAVYPSTGFSWLTPES